MKILHFHRVTTGKPSNLILMLLTQVEREGQVFIYRTSKIHLQGESQRGNRVSGVDRRII